jgi:hypothetical protein
MFSTPKSRKWVNKKSFVISVPWLRLSPLMHCGDFFWLAGMQYLLCQSRWQMRWVKSFVSMPVIRIQLLSYVGVSEIIDKLVDSIWRLRQLWVHCYSVLCSSSLDTFSRHYRREYGGLAIHGRQCHAWWWATQLQYLSVIDLTGTTHKL